MAEYSQHSDSVESLRVRIFSAIGELTVPKTVGARLCQRLGKRAWQRPNVAISGRLYRKYGVEDPWDPNSDNKGRELGLGPVGLRLTEPRRQVAPHLKPKEPRSKKKTQAVDRSRDGERSPTPVHAEKASHHRNPLKLRLKTHRLDTGFGASCPCVRIWQKSLQQKGVHPASLAPRLNLHPSRPPPRHRYQSMLKRVVVVVLGFE